MVGSSEPDRGAPESKESPDGLLVRRTKQKHSPEEPPSKLYVIKEYPTLHKAVRTVSPRREREDGPSRRTGTAHAIAQDRYRTLSRQRQQVTAYILHNMLCTRLTLTWRDDELPDGWKRAQRHMKAFVCEMQKSELVNTWPRRWFPYLYVISVNGENDRFHVHLALPIGFSQELVQEWWHHGVVTLDGCTPEEALGASAEYLVKNIEESGHLRGRADGYHVAAGCQPPEEVTVFRTEAAQLAYFYLDERITTSYWMPEVSHRWRTVEVRRDVPPPWEVERGRAGLATNLPAGPCLHGIRGCPTCHPPRTPQRPRNRPVLPRKPTL